MKMLVDFCDHFKYSHMSIFYPNVFLLFHFINCLTQQIRYTIASVMMIIVGKMRLI
jgi:hypothetical protein